MEKINKVINYITTKYKELETENIGGYKNINRYTKPTMANYAENAIAILINEILKEKKYNYLIDAQLYVGKSKTIRPDIIIYDNNNVIHGIIQVKAQIGYETENVKEKYNTKLKQLEDASNKGILKISKIKQLFTISKNYKECIVILMSANSHSFKENFKGLNYFVIFDNNNSGNWYHNLSKELLNHNTNGIDDFIDFISQIGK